MIPSNSFTPTPVVTPFISPYNAAYTPLMQIVSGGVAINNPSLGRLYQNWTATYIGGNIEVKPQSGPVAFSLAVPGVLTVSLAFDNNMGVVLSWMTATAANLYWYDSVLPGYTITSYPGATSCRICVDNSKEFYTADSDVIFSYTMSGNLYWRQQRDRYTIERLVGPTSKLLVRMAPSLGNRLQFELR